MLQIIDPIKKQLRKLWFKSITAVRKISNKNVYSLGFNREVVRKLNSRISKLNINSKCLVINDFNYILINHLLSNNIQPENITSVMVVSKENHDDIRMVEYMRTFNKNNQCILSRIKIVYLYIEEFDKIIEEKLKNMNFDLIIANPPYEVGNEITQSIINNVNFNQYINLMPLTDYSKNDLFRAVNIKKPVEPYDWQTDGANVTTCFCELHKTERNDLDYEGFMTYSYKEEFRDFYRLNQYFINKKAYFEYIGSKKCDEYIPDSDMDFLITRRTAKDGVHKTTDCSDYRFNVLKLYDLNDVSILPRDISSNSWGCKFIKFNNKKCKSHLCQFWYNNPLMNELIKGLNASGRVYPLYIPNIDWSKEDRNYEKMGLEDIMRYLKEDNK